MIKKIITDILQGCLGCRAGEVLFFLYEPEVEYLLNELKECAKDLDIELKPHKLKSPTTLIRSKEEQVFEFTDEQTKDIYDSDIALIFSSRDISCSKILVECCNHLGLRGLLFKPYKEEELIKLFSINHFELSRACEELKNILSKSRTIKVKSQNGGELTFSIEDRLPHIESGICAFPGLFATQPAGKVFVAIREGTTDGVLYIDSTFEGYGKLDTVYRVVVENGVIKQTDCKILNDLIKKHDASALGFGEFGIGLNPNLEITGDISFDDKVFKNIYFGLGNNKDIGGIISSAVRYRFVFGVGEIYADGKLINIDEITRYKEKYPATQIHILQKTDSPQLSMYEVIFKRSNDPQYVLDLETQNFLEANASFLQLTGYTKEELLSGSIKAIDIIPPEARHIYSKKRETRKYVSSERYQIRIMTKGGDRKLVEVSVQRILMNGKDILIGSLRDLTESENMKRVLREQVRNALDANLRVVALTEKLRNLPNFTPHILSSGTEDELFKKASQMFCDKQGLGYVEATFYLIENDNLILKYTTVPEQKSTRQIPLNSDNELAKIVTLQIPPKEGGTQSILPIKGKEKVLGLLEVRMSEKEMELLEKNEPAKKGYFDVLRTLANIIGLVIENLRLYETVKKQSITDQLTGVFNRRFLDNKIVDEFKRARRYGRELSVLLIDLDNFKPVNDNCGHAVGDYLLKEVADIFIKYSRDSDIVCRYGGDEFVIILPETDYKNAVRKGEILRRKVERYDFSKSLNSNYKFNISLSIGVCSLSKEISSSDELLRKADEACYLAKKKGKNTIVVADEIK